MHNNSISNLLDLKDIYVKNIKHNDHTVKLYLTSTSKPTQCPACNNLTSRVHDYRNQVIKDLPIMNKHTFLILRKRRYVCSCGKKFYEKYNFLPRYRRMTNRLAAYICTKLTQCVPITSVAQEVNLSPPTVTRIFDNVQYPRALTMPSVLSIDEFKGNTEYGKYQCTLVDVKKKKIIDVLPDRKQDYLIEYFSSIPRFERDKVKFFVSDMWKQYADLARIYFPNAKIIIDKYHFIRQVSWAIENVRKRVQKTMPANLRRYFKRSRRLILKRNEKLTYEEKIQLENLLYYNDDLRQAYLLKEQFFDICHMTKYSEQRKAFSNWIKYAETQNIPEFKSCIKTYRNWHKEILNAFKYGYTNGVIEGYNNKIKVLKRVSYGVRKFNRFRNRILHVTN